MNGMWQFGLSPSSHGTTFYAKKDIQQSKVSPVVVVVVVVGVEEMEVEVVGIDFSVVDVFYLFFR